MNITFGGGFLGKKEALLYQGREILKQLAKYHTINIDSNPVGGYWEKFFNNFKQEEENIYIMNGHVPYLPELAKTHKKIISITQFETTLPKDWVEALNIPEVVEIWVTSKFVRELVLESGVRKPVKVVYLGLDKRFFKKGINIFKKDKSFKFLNISAPHGLGRKDRKGLDILIEAFKEEFGDNPEFTLILKINTIYCDLYNKKLGKQFNLHKYLFDLIPEGFDTKNIAIITRYLSTEELNNLYNSVDCGVFPARSEGFGLSQCELAKLGIPTITTNYSSTNEFSDPRLRIKIKKELEPLDYDIYPYGKGLFAEPDVNSLRKIMRMVYEEYNIEKVFAEKHSKTLDKFSWDLIGVKLSSLLKNK